jgi:hypothetical protein
MPASPMLIPALALALILVNVILVWWITRRKLAVHRFCLLPFWIAVAYEVLAVFPSTFAGWYVGSTALLPQYAEGLVFETDAMPMLVWSVAFLALLIGYGLAGGVSHQHARRVRAFLAEPFETVPSTMAIAVVSAAVFVAIVAAGLYFYRGLPPLMDVFSSNETFADVAASMPEARRSLTKGHYFGEAYRGQRIVLFVLTIGFPWLAALTVTNVGRRRPVWLAGFATVMLLGLIFLAGGGVRSRFLDMLLIVYIAGTLRSAVKVHRLGAFVAGVLCVGVALSVLSGKVPIGVEMLETAGRGIERVATRVTLGNGVHNLWVIQLQREGLMRPEHGSLHLDKALNAVPGIERAPFANQLAELAQGDEETTTYASMTGLGLGYADGGMIGAALVYLAAGLCLGLVERWLFTRRKNQLNLATIAVTTLHAGKLSYLNTIAFATNLGVCLALAGAALALATFVDWLAVRRRLPPIGVGAVAHSHE